MQRLSILLDPHEDESATGFLLRSFARNRTRAMTVFNALQIPWQPDLHHSALPVLSELTNVDLHWLQSRTPVQAMDSRHLWSWRGRVWRGHQTVRPTGMRICPACIHEFGYCRLQWDLGFYAACPLHRSLLVNHCGACGRAVRWHRPSTDVCACKRVFSRTPEIDMSATAISWLTWVASSLSSDADVGLPADLRSIFPPHLSIDAMWRTIHAFGARPVAASEGACCLRDESIERADLFGVTERGLFRLRAFAEGRCIRDSVHASALRLLCTRGISAMDRRWALQLVSRLGISYQTGNDTKVYDAQRELFE